MKLFVVFLAICLSSCQAFDRVSPSGAVIKKEHTVAQYSKVSVSGGIALIVSVGDSCKLEIEANENLHQYIEVEVKEDVLVIKRTRRVNFTNNVVMTAYVSAPRFDQISASGGSRANIVDTISTEHLVIKASGGASVQGNMICNDLKISMGGGSNANLTFKCTSMKASIGGGGTMTLEGTANNADLDMSGGSKAHATINCQTLTSEASGGGGLTLIGSAKDYKMSASGGSWISGFDFITQNLSAHLSGGGHADITVNGEISVNASGGGRVNYKGSAVTKNVSLSGGASINKIN